MKLKALVFVVGALLGTSAAHAAGTTWLGLTGGVGLPMGDFSDVASTGFHVGGTGTYMMNDQVGLGGDIVFHSFGGNDDLEKSLTALAGSPVDLKTTIIQVMATGRYYLPEQGKLTPYAKLGLGLNNIKFDAGGSDESKTKFGFLIGLGGMWKMSESYGYGLNVAYQMFGSQNAPGSTGDVSLSGVTVSADLMFGLSK